MDLRDFDSLRVDFDHLKLELAVYGVVNPVYKERILVLLRDFDSLEVDFSV